MLLKGISTSAIARFIQEEQGELTSMSSETISARLRDWRQAVPPAQRIGMIRGDVVESAQEELDKGMDELRELRGLLRIQKERIESIRQRELDHDNVNPALGREIQLGVDIIQQHAAIRVQLGLTGEGSSNVPSSVEEKLIEAYGDAGERVQKVIDNPVSRRKLLGMAEKIKLLAGIDIGIPGTETPSAAEEPNGVQEESTP